MGFVFKQNNWFYHSVRCTCPDKGRVFWHLQHRGCWIFLHSFSFLFFFFSSAPFPVLFSCLYGDWDTQPIRANPVYKCIYLYFSLSLSLSVLKVNLCHLLGERLPFQVPLSGKFCLLWGSTCTYCIIFLKRNICETWELIA